MISWSDSPGLADMQRFVPLGDGLEVRSDQPLDVVLDLRREFRSVLDDEPGATVEGAPDAERRREAVAALDATITRAQQAERRTVPARQHQVAGQRSTIPLEKTNGLVLSHARLEAEQRGFELRSKCDTRRTRRRRVAPLR